MNNESKSDNGNEVKNDEDHMKHGKILTPEEIERLLAGRWSQEEIDRLKNKTKNKNELLTQRDVEMLLCAVQFEYEGRKERKDKKF